MTRAAPDYRAMGAALAAESRARQGLPPTVTDPVVLAKVAAILAPAVARASGTSRPARPAPPTERHDEIDPLYVRAFYESAERDAAAALSDDDLTTATRYKHPAAWLRNLVHERARKATQEHLGCTPTEVWNLLRLTPEPPSATEHHAT